MKYKHSIVSILIVIATIFLLAFMNVIKLSRGILSYELLVIAILLISLFTIVMQRHINKHHTENKINLDNLDLVKYIFSILIIILHFRPFLNSSSILDLIFNNIVTRICVPFFFIVTGFLVAKKDSDYIKKYIKKLISLYLVWSIIYIPVLLINIYMNWSNINTIISHYVVGMSSLNIIPTFIIMGPIAIIVAIFYIGIYYHLWYFPATIMSLLILDKWRSKFNIKYLLLISFILLIFGATETYYGVMPSSIKMLLDNYYTYFFTTRNFLFFGLFYVVAGYYLGKKENIHSHNSFAKLLFSSGLLVLEALYLQNVTRLNSNILLMSLPVNYYLLICILYLNSKTAIVSKFHLRELSKYYYLIHPAIILMFAYILKLNSKSLPITILLLISVTIITHILTIIIIKLKHKYNLKFI